jgi:hypothetical protein
MKVTVAICTWNRARLLDRTLARLQELTVPEGVGWELLVVNNNCTDATDAVLARHATRLPLRRLAEPRQGHAHARNRAVRAAAGSLILWTDDDVLVDSGWLAGYVQAARDWPHATFFGGPIEPLFERPPPRPIRANLDMLQGPLVILRLGEAVHPFPGDELPFGANMAFRTDVLKGFPFDSALGFRGAEKTGGDETDVLERMRGAGHQGLWVGTARVRHYIPTSRLSLASLAAWFRGNGRATARLSSGDKLPLFLGLPRSAVRRYVELQVKALACWPVSRSRWLRFYLQAQRLRGFLAEWLRNHRPTGPRHEAWQEGTAGAV